MARVVSAAHRLFGSTPQVQSAALLPAMISTADLVDGSMFRSFHTPDPEHRPDRGMRGLATPFRLAGASSERQVDLQFLWDECGRSSDAADLGMSSQVIARTLLAPVMNPVAELAGYSGREVTPTFRPVLPSIFAPGMDDPFAATGNTLRSVGSDRRTVDHWLSRLNPIASWSAAATANSQYTPVVHRAESSAAVFRAVAVKSNAFNDASSSESTSSSAHVLASGSDAERVRPSRTVRSAGPDREQRSPARAGSPVTWPQPEQLYRDLASIASDDEQQLAVPSQVAGASTLTSVGAPFANTFVYSLERQTTTLAMSNWAQQVERVLEELRSLPRIGDERSGDQIRELAALSETGLQLAERVPARDQQVRWLRASHALARRAAVWGPIWQLARMQGDETDSPAGEVVTSVPGAEREREQAGYSLAKFQNDAFVTASPGDRDHVLESVSVVRRHLHETGDAAGWDAFLLLGPIETAAENADADERAVLAQRFLSRLDHHSLHDAHRKWLKQDAVSALAVAMQSWTARPIDYARLLSDLERGETDSIDLAAMKVTEAFQTLRFSTSLDAARVAKSIDVTYRNANVRTAISVDLLNRFLPDQPARTEPIRTTVLGNAVRGTSTVNSSLSLQLQPSPDAWQLALGTTGDVATRSHGGQSGVTVLSSGHNTFQAHTPLIIRPDGFRVGETSVNVTGSQHLRGIHSPYEGWPLIGSLVHGIAENRFEEALPVARQISSDQIRSQVTTEVQTQLNEKTSIAGTRLDELVLGPLGRLALDPKVIDLQTTPKRLIARYRLAGDWQLASHTPRPRAWSDSWVSVQIHQSALNNTLERLLPTGDAKSIQQFYNDTMELFGQAAQPLPSDVPGDAMIEFASTRPVTVEIEDGKVWLTLRIVRLSEPDGPALTRFIVRAGYEPRVEGLNAHLVRDGHLSISGPGMTMGQRIAVRALFIKILSEQRPIPITGPRITEHPAMQGLAISQLELRDGWLALAISPESSPRVAAAARSEKKR